MPPEPPRLHTNSQTLSLSFESSLIQSSMRHDAPFELVLDYTRTMMGFVLFNPAPAAILMIGLGGGSMVKYLHRYLPYADLTVLEIHPGVIDLRADFMVPPDDARLHVLCADGAAFIAQPPQTYDVILVDGFDSQGLPDALCSRAFYQRCRAALSPGGVMVANVQADGAQTQEVLRRVNRAFSGAAIQVESDEGGNQIVLAASRTVLDACHQHFAQRWDELGSVHQATLAVAAGRFECALQQQARAPLGKVHKLQT